MFSRDAAMYFFFLAFFICFSWRFLYVFITPLLSRRYIAFLIIFFVIIAIPGFCFVMDVVCNLIRKKYNISRNRIILIIILLIATISIIKGVYVSGKKNFIKDTGIFIENYCRQNNISDFVLLDGTGEGGRIAFYSGILKEKTFYIGNYKDKASDYVSYVDNNINHFHLRLRKNVLLILKAKSMELFFNDYKMYSKSNFKLNRLKVFNDRKYEYFILEVN